MAKKALGFLLCLALLGGFFVFGGCGSQQQAASENKPGKQAAALKDSGKDRELKVYICAGLKKPMDAVIAKFQEEKGVKVIPNYGPSGGLWAQIKEGQPCDLYYSADWIYIEMANEEGKLSEYRKFLKDNLALVVSPSAKDKVKSVQDLAKPGVTFVVCDPKAPVGAYAETALKNLGLWEKVQGNLKARPSTVNQAAIMVKEDQVDAGLIYVSVAAGNGLHQAQVLGEDATGEIVFGVGVIKGANESLAKEFMEFAVQHVDEFTKYGWKPYA